MNLIHQEMICTTWRTDLVVEKVNYNYDPRYAVYIEVYGKYKNRDLMLSATQYASGTLNIGESPDDYTCELAK